MAAFDDHLVTMVSTGGGAYEPIFDPVLLDDDRGLEEQVEEAVDHRIVACLGVRAMRLS